MERNYARLNNIYRGLIFITFSGPVLSAFIATRSYFLAIVILLCIAIFPHILLYRKIHNKPEDSFKIEITKILKTFYISMGVILVALLPTIGLLILDDTSQSTENYFIKILIAAGWILGPILSWTFYMYKTIENYSIVERG